jgi:pimeloyl-ACP methyl ester carboxylesterase
LSALPPIILIPGFMGSRLERVRDNQTIWVDLEFALGHLPELLRELTLTTPGDLGLVPQGVLENVPFGNVIHFGIYSQLRQWMTSSHGIGLPARDYHEYSYDWRKSLVSAAVDLDAYLLGITANPPLTLIAHSQGGLVVSKLFELGGPGSRRVGKIIAVGCPFAGLLKTIDMIEAGTGVLTSLFPHDPIRSLLRGMPGAYEMMPSRPAPALFFFPKGTATTPFSSPGSFPADRYDPALLAAAGSVVGRLPVAFPVPIVLIEGYGLPTAVSATAAEGGAIAVQHGFEGDGTCPTASLLAASGPTRKIFSVPFGEHVELVRDPAVLNYFRDELTGGGAVAPQIAAKVRFPAHPPGAENLLVIETRKPDGTALGTGAPTAVLPDGSTVTLSACPIEGDARWVGTFAQPLMPGPLRVNVAGVAQQPAQILLA